MRLPDFLIIGAAKSGTSSLYNYLRRHHQIFMPDRKEPQFFDVNYGNGVEWYSALFNNAKPDQVCGEATTAYTHRTHLFPVPDRIYALLPNTKFIYIMRNPVDRAYSQYVQQIKVGQVKQRNLNDSSFEIPETFEELLKRGDSVAQVDDYMEKVKVLAPSMYMDRINEYLEFFPKESFLFLLFEDLIENPEDTLRNICEFIGVDSTIDIVGNEEAVENRAENHKDWYIRSRFTKPLRGIPGMKIIKSLLPKGFKDGAYQVLKKLPYKKDLEQQYIPQKMLPETRQMLLAKFEEPNQRLAEFLNKDLSRWSS
ncbi:MAG: hypothetical protein ACJAZQ_002324 [Cognaticolwellia sp.]|jgi:hypothetical protein